MDKGSLFTVQGVFRNTRLAKSHRKTCRVTRSNDLMKAFLTFLELQLNRKSLVLVCVNEVLKKLYYCVGTNFMHVESLGPMM